MMALMAKCGRKRVDSHACRNLHSLIWRTGKVLPVTISTVTMRKRISRRKLAAIPTLHPLLKLRDWATTIFKYGGHFFLRGKSLEHAGSFGEELRDFWGKIAVAEPQLPLPDPERWHQHIPVCIHGDEGRGRQGQPVLVLSYQPLLPLQDQKSTMAVHLGFLLGPSSSGWLFQFQWWAIPTCTIWYLWGPCQSQANLVHTVALYAAPVPIFKRELEDCSWRNGERFEPHACWWHHSNSFQFQQIFIFSLVPALQNAQNCVNPYSAALSRWSGTGSSTRTSSPTQGAKGTGRSYGLPLDWTVDTTAQGNAIDVT